MHARTASAASTMLCRSASAAPRSRNTAVRRSPSTRSVVSVTAQNTPSTEPSGSMIGLYVNVKYASSR